MNRTPANKAGSFWALFLSLCLSLPAPAFALRQLNAGTEETPVNKQLRARFGIPDFTQANDPTAGVEETKKPNNPYAWMVLGEVRFQQGRFDEAEVAYQEAIKLDLDSADAWIGLGHARLEQNRYAEAEAAYLKVTQLASGDVAAWTGLGDARFEQDRYAEAEVAYLKATELAPRDLNAWRSLGRARRMQEDRYAEAKAAYQEVTELAPDDIDAWIDLGRVSFVLDRRAKAEAAYQEGMMAFLGNAQLAQNRFAEAEAAYLKAIKLAPDNANAWTGLGEVRFQQGRFAEAEAAYLKATELAPDDVHGWINLGGARFAQDRYAEAEAAYLKASEVAPDNRNAWAFLGNAQFKQDRFADAETAYRKAIEMAPRDLDAWTGLGDALHKQGSEGKAFRAYLGPDGLNLDSTGLEELREAAVQQIWDKVRELGTLDEIRSMPLETFARKVGVKVINRAGIGRPIFTLSEQFYENLAVLRKTGRLPSGVAATSYAPLADNTDIDGPGIYLATKDLQALRQAIRESGKLMEYNKGTFIHELLEEAFAQAGVVDPVLHLFRQHTDPAVIEEEMLFNGLMSLQDVQQAAEIYRGMKEGVEDILLSRPEDYFPEIQKQYRALRGEIAVEQIAQSLGLQSPYYRTLGWAFETPPDRLEELAKQRWQGASFKSFVQSAGLEEVNETAFRQLVKTGPMQEALRVQGYTALDAAQAAALGVEAIGGFIVADSTRATEAEHFIVAESGLVNVAALAAFPWINVGGNLSAIIEFAKGAQAKTGDLILLKPAPGISAESIAEALRQEGFTDSNAPRVGVGDANRISALPSVTFQLLAGQKGLPPVVFLNIAVRLKDEAGNSYTLLLMA